MKKFLVYSLVVGTLAYMAGDMAENSITKAALSKAAILETI